MVSQTCMVEAPPPRTPELSVLGLRPEVVYSRPGGAEQTQLTRLTPNMEERMQAIQVSVRALLLLQPGGNQEGLHEGTAREAGSGGWELQGGAARVVVGGGSYRGAQPGSWVVGDGS